MKHAGYATCLAGKWHCNSRFNQPEQPQPDDFGFDHWLATQNNADPSHENPTNYVRNGKSAGPIEGYSCQIVVDEAVDWLKVLEDRSQPFFVFLSFHEPHEPVASPPDLVARYRDQARNEDEAQYFANVANVDAAVGRFLRELDGLKRRENTLVVFTSDNGPETLKRYRGAERSYGQPGPLRGMKLHTHDAGFRVAGIMNWRGHVRGGQVSRIPVSSLDFLPTFCRLSNAAVPSHLELDGTSFLPALRRQPIERKQPLVWAYFNAINEARVAMRDGQWKVLARLNGGQVPKLQNITSATIPTVRDVELTDIEIYDAWADPAEENNLLTSRPTLAQELSVKLDSRYQELVRSSHVWVPVIE